MNEIVPRWEFRVFGQDLERPLTALLDLGQPGGEDESRETYFVARRAGRHNIKVRDGKLDMKKLLETRERLERWKPTMKESLPLGRDWIGEALLPALGHPAMELEHEEYGLRQLVDAFRSGNSCIGIARLYKRRRRFTVDACAAEHDEILVNGAAIRSMAVESEDAAAVLRVIARLALDGHENLSYPNVIRRLAGFEAWPGDAQHG